MRTRPTTSAVPRPSFCVNQPGPSGAVLWCDVMWCHVMSCDDACGSLGCDQMTAKCIKRPLQSLKLPKHNETTQWLLWSSGTAQRTQHPPQCAEQTWDANMQNPRLSGLQDVKDRILEAQRWHLKLPVFQDRISCSGYLSKTHTVVARHPQKVKA